MGDLIVKVSGFIIVFQLGDREMKVPGVETQKLDVWKINITLGGYR